MNRVKALLSAVVIALSFGMCAVGCTPERTSDIPDNPNVIPNNPSDTSASAVKIKDIDDIEKGHFPIIQMNSTVNLALDEYVDANDTSVSYSVTIQDPSVASYSLDGNTLKLRTVNGDKQTNVTVSVYSDGNSAFELSFTLTTKLYKNIVCVGDSLTAGHDNLYKRYSDQLQEMLGNQFSIKNCGLNGANATGFGGIGSTGKYDTLSQYTNSLAGEPDLILFMLGTNDATGWVNAEATFKTEYEKLINSYLAIDGVKVMVITSPPTAENNNFGIPNTVIKEKVNPIQRSVAENMGLPLADLRKAFEEKSGGYGDLIRQNDGVHFTYEGGRFVAEFLKAEIEKL